MTADGGSTLERAFLGLVGREDDPRALDAATLANMVAGHHSLVDVLTPEQRTALHGLVGGIVERMALAALPVSHARSMVIARRPSFAAVLNTPEGLAWLTHEIGRLREIAAGQ